VRFRLLVASCVATVAAVSAFAANVLFPAPLHLTRQVHDSIGGSTEVVEQYCYGDRVISVKGAVTTIADYGKGELTEINRDEGTWSVTRFDDVARSLRAGVAERTVKGKWVIQSTGLTQLRTTRASNAFEGELEEGGTKRHSRVAVDRSVRLSKDALDVLIGAAYPNSRKLEDTVVVEATKLEAAKSGDAASTFALPVEQQHTFVIDGLRAEVRDVVTRVGAELVPADLVAIPPDARLVQSRLLQRMQAFEQIESAGRTPPSPQKQ
jgi:hypothetical protein